MTPTPKLSRQLQEIYSVFRRGLSLELQLTLIYANMTKNKPILTHLMLCFWEHYNNSLFWELYQRYQDHTHIYTDVSKIQNGIGYSIVFEHSTIKFELHQDTSILTAEHSALKHSPEITSKYHNKKFAIFSAQILSVHSTNTIALILNQLTNNTTIHEFQNAYIESIKNNSSITVIWIPSHTGIAMNERADKVTKEAANSTIPYHNTNLSLDSLLVHLKQKVKRHWNNYWTTLVKPRLLAIKNDFYKNVIPSTLKRRHQIVISRIIIRHTKIAYKLIFTKEDQPLCERCKTTLTRDHLIL